MLLGGVLSTALFFGPVDIGLRLIDFHSFILTGTLMILGLTMISFSTITHVYAYNAGLLPTRPGFFRLFRIFNLERGLAVGFMFLLIGMIIIYRAIILSRPPGFESLGFDQSIRLVFGGSISIIIGGQIVFTSFVLSILGIKTNKKGLVIGA